MTNQDDLSQINKKKLFQIKIHDLNTFTRLKEHIIMPEKLADILDNQILNETFKKNFAALSEIYLRIILVIYEFKTRIKEIIRADDEDFFL